MAEKSSLHFITNEAIFNLKNPIIIIIRIKSYSDLLAALWVNLVE